MFSIKHLETELFPSLLKEIPQPPKQLNYRGALPPTDIQLISVVGSRRYTTYGQQVVEKLIGGLAGYPIGIVSGLALGIDSIAHEEALRAGLYTLAIPGGGIDDSVIYPARHKPLARRILDSGGCLLSEYEPTFKATTWSFPERNRLVCGISKATLVVEAGERSGSLITARLCVDYNRELLVVPGSIFSENSRGTHQFLKLGATPVTSTKDILEVLQLPEYLPQTSTPSDLSPKEEEILAALHNPTDKDTLLRGLSFSIAEAVPILMQMELNGLIIEEGGFYTKVTT